ncbi:hypothetical protein CDD83_6734 [Cordyceps sp. RAO-2017]|nr:hypothetical protein CDD83_6734 [Cordyceps sp. RAO-2017]
MLPPSRLVVILPLVLAFVSFVLSSITLFSGHKQGFMEDYAIVRLNTSMIGHNLVDKAKDGGAKGDEGKDGPLGRLQSWWDDKKSDAKDKIDSAKGKVAGKIAGKIGLSQWYSLHIMDACEGSFEPDPTAPNAGLNTTNCTTSAPAHRLNLTQILDHKLNVGRLGVGLNDLGWTDSVQDKLDILNDTLLGLFIVYVLGMGLSGLSMLLNLAALFLLGKSGAVVLANFMAASLAALCCIIGSVITTAAGSKAVDQINKRGARVGLAAERGSKFYIIGWITTGFMFAVTAFWLVQFLLLRRKRAAVLKTMEKGGS